MTAATDDAFATVDLASMIIGPTFGDIVDCSFYGPKSAVDRIKVSSAPSAGPRIGYRIALTQPVFNGSLNILLGPGGGTITIDSAGPINLAIRMWRNATLSVGAGTTITQGRIICDQADVKIGADGLWSDEIILQSNDQHGIIDLASGAVLNAGRRRVAIGAHVWIGRRAMIMPDVAIGDGSILAAGAILTSDMEPNSVYAGVPARKVRGGASWSRSPEGFTPQEKTYVCTGDLNA